MEDVDNDPWNQMRIMAWMIKEQYKSGLSLRLLRMTKSKYLPGMRVRLLKMDDVQAPPVVTEGKVRGVDDIGSVLVAWDNGCGLNVVLDEDKIEIVG